ncbi:MAG TPA: pyruvate dehydrogenase complex dihydrolipoamide acetyltransferase [Pyrinomonadaceae bacterium]|nr:pyruvate dehydrogenase complex dihydrolipoamide acetyltransferase [Pyrinomonadaceae bacterium]
MATQVVMPKLSPTMEEGQLSRWLKQEGDRVTVGEPLAEIDTDKATMEAQALAEGVLRKIVVAEGTTVPLGQVIAIIGAPDEDISALLSQVESGKASADNKQTIGRNVEAGQDGAQAELAQVVPGGPRTQATIQGAPLEGDADTARAKGSDEAATPQPATQAQTQTGQQQPPQTPPPGGDGRETGNGQRGDGRLIVSPIAARMAADANINLQTLAGSGPGGRIVKRDIEAAIKSGGGPQADAGQPRTQPQLRAVEARAPQPAAPVRQPQIEGASRYRDEPMTAMRATIARRLVTSIGPVPHFFLTTEIEMDAASELRRKLNEIDESVKISLNDIIIKVAAVALRQHPQVNASFQDKSIRYYERADIGVAVAIDDGLITPVVRGADAKSIGSISREVRELAERARGRKLKPEEYTGATFSVSNLGMFGIDEFTAVINPPEAAILAVGAATAKPVVRDGAVVVRQIMRVTMSCDHRVIDGATGAKFLQTFKRLLENPLLLLA